MNFIYKRFLVVQPDGRLRFNYRALLYLFLAICVLNALISLFFLIESKLSNPREAPTRPVYKDSPKLN